MNIVKIADEGFLGIVTIPGLYNGHDGEEK